MSASRDAAITEVIRKMPAMLSEIMAQVSPSSGNLYLEQEMQRRALWTQGLMLGIAVGVADVALARRILEWCQRETAADLEKGIGSLRDELLEAAR